MIGVLPVLLLGFLLGVKHASETDHLAAVATLVTQQSSLRHTIRQGVAWGLGHAVTLGLIGGIVLALGHSLPAKVASGLELAVGIMLVLLGLDVLRRWRQHIHTHGDWLGGWMPWYTRRHPRPPETSIIAHTAIEHEQRHPSGSPLRALAVGMMHGMAGSAALIMLSLQAVSSWSLGLLYIVIFGAGSILGMALLSVVLAMPLRLTARTAGGLNHALTALVGLFGCGLGLTVIYRIGITGGLLLR